MNQQDKREAQRTFDVTANLNDDAITPKMKRRRCGHKLAQCVPEARLRAKGVALGKQRNDSFLAPQACAQRSGAQTKTCAAPLALIRRT